MLNANKLKGRIVERGKSVEDVAESIGVARSTLYRKMSGDFPFTIDEVSRIISFLELSSEDAIAIFFSQLVPETRQA